MLHFKRPLLRFRKARQTQYFGRRHRWDTQAHWVLPAGPRTRSSKTTICKITVRRVPERIRRTRRQPEAEKYLRSAATHQSTGHRQVCVQCRTMKCTCVKQNKTLCSSKCHSSFECCNNKTYCNLIRTFVIILTHG